MQKDEPLLYIDSKQDGDFTLKNQKTYYKKEEVNEEVKDENKKSYLSKLARLEKFIKTKRTIISEFILTDMVVEGELKEKNEDYLIIKTENDEVKIDPKKIIEINILKV